MTTRNEPSPQDGVATVALVLVLVPLMLVIGSYLQTMSERNQRLSLEVREEQALLAAESGIDYALNEARRGTLTAGSGAAFPFAPRSRSSASTWAATASTTTATATSTRRTRTCSRS